MRVSVLPVLLLLAACDRQSTPQPQGEPAKPASPATMAAPSKADYSHKGAPAPANAFAAPNGDSVTFADFKGRPILVNLWATWCAPCLKELPSIDVLAAREAEGLQVLAISQDMKGRAVVAPWWDKQGFKLLEPYVDEKADLSFAFGGGSLPMTILFDAQGKEVWRVVGEMDWAGDAAKALIAEAKG